MSVSGPQRIINSLWLVSWQRWLFIASCVLTAVAASAGTAMAAGQQTGVVLVIIVVLAAGTAASPDSHTALVVEIVVVWHWLASSNDPTSPWVVLVAVALFLFHSVVALMAATPITAVVDATTLRRWAIRCSGVVLATVAVWPVVELMSRRDASGNAALMFTALAVLAVCAVVARTRGASSTHD